MQNARLYSEPLHYVQYAMKTEGIANRWCSTATSRQEHLKAFNKGGKGRRGKGGGGRERDKGSLDRGLTRSMPVMRRMVLRMSAWEAERACIDTHTQPAATMDGVYSISLASATRKEAHGYFKLLHLMSYIGSAHLSC